jgi:hypothetical protein
MISDPPTDPLGSLLVEIRDDIDVDALVDGRVRGGEPAAGDVQPAGKYKAFIVISTLDDPPHPRIPVRFATYSVRMYGTTYQNASAIYAAVVKAIHMVGPHRKANGLGIYWTTVISGGSQDRDPDTAQPLTTAVISLIGTTQAVPA